MSRRSMEYTRRRHLPAVVCDSCEDDDASVALWLKWSWHPFLVCYLCLAMAVGPWVSPTVDPYSQRKLCGSQVSKCSWLADSARETAECRGGHDQSLPLSPPSQSGAALPTRTLIHRGTSPVAVFATVPGESGGSVSADIFVPSAELKGLERDEKLEGTRGRRRGRAESLSNAARGCPLRRISSPVRGVINERVEIPVA